MVSGRDTKEYRDMTDKHSQKYDYHVRHFLHLHCSDLYDPEFRSSNLLAQKIWYRVFFPVIAGSNPTNNFYLQFPDLLPLFPSHSIDSKFLEFVKVSELVQLNTNLSDLYVGA